MAGVSKVISASALPALQLPHPEHAMCSHQGQPWAEPAFPFKAASHLSPQGHHGAPPPSGPDPALHSSLSSLEVLLAMNRLTGKINSPRLTYNLIHSETEEGTTKHNSSMKVAVEGQNP